MAGVGGRFAEKPASMYPEGASGMHFLVRELEPVPDTAPPGPGDIPGARKLLFRPVAGSFDGEDLVSNPNPSMEDPYRPEPFPMSLAPRGKFAEGYGMNAKSERVLYQGGQVFKCTLGSCKSPVVGTAGKETAPDCRVGLGIAAPGYNVNKHDADQRACFFLTKDWSNCLYTGADTKFGGGADKGRAGGGGGGGEKGDKVKALPNTKHTPGVTCFAGELHVGYKLHPAGHRIEHSELKDHATAGEGDEVFMWITLSGDLRFRINDEEEFVAIPAEQLKDQPYHVYVYLFGKGFTLNYCCMLDAATARTDEYVSQLEDQYDADGNLLALDL